MSSSRELLWFEGQSQSQAACVKAWIPLHTVWFDKLCCLFWTSPIALCRSHVAKSTVVVQPGNPTLSRISQIDKTLSHFFTQHGATNQLMRLPYPCSSIRVSSIGLAGGPNFEEAAAVEQKCLNLRQTGPGFTQKKVSARCMHWPHPCPPQHKQTACAPTACAPKAPCQNAP